MNKNNIMTISITVILCLILIAGTVIVVRKIDEKDVLTDEMVSEVKTDSKQKVNSKNATAEEIINLMKEKNSNIGKIVVYNEENDLNNLLGRPNQYTSKIQFADNRLDQSYVEENDAKGGTIEVFNSKEDMENRKKYIETISTQASIFAQYIYSKGNAILRLDTELTPEQAKEYETIFNEIVK